MKSGKFDLNSASVSDYKKLKGNQGIKVSYESTQWHLHNFNDTGMFPRAAGKIASNGPYKSVSDIYSIKGLSSRDIELFKIHERNFEVLPPGRMFGERLNGRVSS